MTLADLLPWLNLLLLPCVGYLSSINSRLATIEARQTSFAGRLEKLDGIKA